MYMGGRHENPLGVLLECLSVDGFGKVQLVVTLTTLSPRGRPAPSPCMNQWPMVLAIAIVIEVGATEIRADHQYDMTCQSRLLRNPVKTGTVSKRRAMPR